MFSGKRKKQFFARHAKSSAIMISLFLHAILIVVALSFVAVKVYQKRDQSFDQVKIRRPKVPIKKLQVPVDIKKKKVQKPKLRKRIVVQPRQKEIEIQLPELAGIKGGTGYLDDGGGLGLGFSMEVPNLFGSSKSFGNELMGTLYDLKLSNRREPIKMGEKLFFSELRRFCGSWSSARMGKYFQAPKKMFSTVFYIPTCEADAAPKAFGVADIVKPTFWMIHYTGMIAAPETGRYRFWGYGDDVMIVRVNKREVLQGNWNNRKAISWKSESGMNRKYKIFSRKHETLFIGDWITLEKGRSVPIDILVGECAGGQFACALMIEQEGETYEKGRGGRPVLPVFKTKAIPEELAVKMKIRNDESTLEGPVFGAKNELKAGMDFSF